MIKPPLTGSYFWGVVSQSFSSLTRPTLFSLRFLVGVFAGLVPHRRLGSASSPPMWSSPSDRGRWRTLNDLPICAYHTCDFTYLTIPYLRCQVSYLWIYILDHTTLAIYPFAFTILAILHAWQCHTCDIKCHTCEFTNLTIPYLRFTYLRVPYLRLYILNNIILAISSVILANLHTWPYHTCDIRSHTCDYENILAI